jgi:hypothetical protein
VQPWEGDKSLIAPSKRVLEGVFIAQVQIIKFHFMAVEKFDKFILSVALCGVFFDSKYD